MRPVRAPARIGAAAALVVAVAAALAPAASPPRTSTSSRPAAASASSHPATPPAHSARVALIGGKALQSARCGQWRRGTAAERAAIVATLAQVVGGPTPYGRANALPDPEAHRLFDRACSHFYARGFLLYELYTRAAGFYAPTSRHSL